MRATTVTVAVLVCVGAAGGAYAWYFNTRVVPGISVARLPLGGFTRDEAAAELAKAVDEFGARGTTLSIAGQKETVYPDEVAFDFDIGRSVSEAYGYGHDGSGFRRVWERIASLWSRRSLDAHISFDESLLRDQVATIARTHDIPRHDVRLAVVGTRVTVLTDTAPGKVIDQEEAYTEMKAALRTLRREPVVLELHDDPPRVTSASSQDAVLQGERILARAVYLAYEEAQFTIDRATIGTWLLSEYEDDRLRAGIDRRLVSEFVTGIASRLDVDPVPPQVTTQEGRVTGFTPPRVGRAIQQDVLVDDIVSTLLSRVSAKPSGDVIAIPMRTTRMSLIGLDGASGITELIGRATTPFTGSPKNRIFNIKNGVKFLSGTVVQAGEEFSTLKTLGAVDNTTGYLPELVIKGDRTTPEYGGGLCQVSTTLFRATLDAGLPVTARRNHSFRVSYYEKDGNGKFIGPGLDATIYEPELDFRFLNDTATPILIVGYVVGDKITFEFYGTKDGRTGKVTGPTILTETPAGEPVYIETTELAPGVTKQVEFPHPGGSTTATYTITYADGTTKTQEFKSWYRRWPATYLVGVAQLSSPSPEPAPALSPTP